MDVKPRVVAAAGCALLLVVAGPWWRDWAGHQQHAIEQPLSLVAITLSDGCASLRLRAGRKALRRGDVRREWTHVPDLPQQQDRRSRRDALARLAEDPNDRSSFMTDSTMASLERAGSPNARRSGSRFPLPPAVVLLNDPTRRSVILNRGTPTTMNTPALDPQLILTPVNQTCRVRRSTPFTDMRKTHGNPRRWSWIIREFQQKDSRFFSSDALGNLRTAVLRRNSRRARRNPNDAAGRCSTMCLSMACRREDLQLVSLGPMLNRAALGNPFGLPPGGLRAGIGVSERNLIGNPVYSFVVTNQDGSVVVVNDTPDPGAMLNDPPPSAPPGVPTPPRAFFANLFKISPLWGIKDTAPWLHDNSAKTLEEVAEHYEFFFFTSPAVGFRVYEAGSGRHGGIPEAASLTGC